MPGMKKSGMPPIGESANSANRMQSEYKKDADAVERTNALPTPPPPMPRQYGVKGTGYGTFKNRK
jgi:hypothetical protein